MGNVPEGMSPELCLSMFKQGIRCHCTLSEESRNGRERVIPVPFLWFSCGSQSVLSVNVVVSKIECVVLCINRSFSLVSEGTSIASVAENRKLEQCSPLWILFI